jgi:ABC-type spermidine/putrescine transport system permease subunit II
MLLLERNGPINRFVIASGLSDQPLSLLLNHTAVLIGMVHVLLPYAVLPIYAALVRIDPALLRASEGLGASAVTTFRRVLFPLALSGIATAATFTFLLALGFSVTPALLGKRLQPDAVDADRRLRQRSPRLAARRGGIRFAAGGGARRRRGRRALRSSGRAREGASMSNTGGRLVLNTFVALVAAFLVLPILAIVPAAFSAQSFIRLPPDAWSLRWWGTFFNDVSGG